MNMICKMTYVTASRIVTIVKNDNKSLCIGHQVGTVCRHLHMHILYFTLG